MLPKKLTFIQIILLLFVISISLINCAVDVVDRVVSYKGYSVIRVVPRTQDNFDYLNNLTYSQDVSYWLEPSFLSRPVDIMISPKKKASVMKGLFHHGMQPKVQIDDIDRLIQSNNDTEEISERAASSEEYFFRSYRRLDEMYSFLRGLSARNKDIMKVENFGKTWEGRDMRVVKIGSEVHNKESTKPIIYIQGGIHAREWIAPATVLFIATALVNERDDETDSGSKDLINKFEWWLVPSTNPDGYEYSHSYNRNWRKTRSKQRGICRGVDPNRNFGHEWGGAGTSGDTCSDIFRGIKPFSEPETRAVRDLVMNASPRVKAFLDMHSYSQVWLYPWGYGDSLPADYQDLHDLAKLASTALAKVHGTRYRVGSTTRLLYAAAGGADDWAKGSANIKYTYTVELRDEGRYGFMLPSRYITPTGEETWAAMRAFARGLKVELDRAENPTPKIL